MNNLFSILTLYDASFGDVTSGKDSHRLYFICPILAFVYCLIDNIEILVEENVHEQSFLNRRVEIVIKRGGGEKNHSCGSKNVENLDEVYGIDTSYMTWYFFRSKNCAIQKDVCLPKSLFYKKLGKSTTCSE